LALERARALAASPTIFPTAAEAIAISSLTESSKSIGFWDEDKAAMKPYVEGW
jgi:hypothetical protein